MADWDYLVRKSNGGDLATDAPSPAYSEPESEPAAGSYASTWDMLTAGDIEGLYEKVSDNPISRSDLWKNDIKPGIVEPFITGASQAVNEWSRAQQQETDAFKEMIDNIATGADRDAVNSSINNYNDASQYVTDAGKLVMKGPLSLIPTIGVGTFVGDAVNKGIEEGSPIAAIRAATYGPATDYISQDNLLNKIIERPVTTLGEGAMSILPLAGAGYVGYKGGKAGLSSIRDYADQRAIDGVIDKNVDLAYPMSKPATYETSPAESASFASHEPTSFRTGIDDTVDSYVAAAANKYGVDPSLLAKVIDQESTYGRNPNAGGNLAQISNDLAREYGLDKTDPAQSIEGGARYLKSLIDDNGGDVREALAAYNGGPGNKQYGYADQVLGREIGGEMGTSRASAGSGMDVGEQAWLGQTMPNGSEGCVEAVVRVGSYHNKWLADEAAKGETYVPNLVRDAGDRVIDFDPSRLEKGDVIVYGNNDHVVLYDGKGGYVGNSSSKNRIVHSSDYNDCGMPTKIIKTADRNGNGNTGITNSSVTDTFGRDVAERAEAIAKENDANVDVMGNKVGGDDAHVINDALKTTADDAMKADVDAIVNRDIPAKMYDDTSKMTPEELRQASHKAAESADYHNAALLAERGGDKHWAQAYRNMAEKEPLAENVLRSDIVKPEEVAVAKANIMDKDPAVRELMKDPELKSTLDDAREAQKIVETSHPDTPEYKQAAATIGWTHDYIDGIKSNPNVNREALADKLYKRYFDKDANPRPEVTDVLRGAPELIEPIVEQPINSVASSFDVSGQNVIRGNADLQMKADVESIINPESNQNHFIAPEKSTVTPETQIQPQKIQPQDAQMKADIESVVNNGLGNEFNVGAEHKLADNAGIADNTESVVVAPRLGGKVTGSYLKDTISRRKLINGLQDLFVTIRTGKIGDKRILGQVNHQTGVIRTQDYGDIPTISHEIGHVVDAALDIRNQSGLSYFDAELTSKARAEHDRASRIAMGDVGGAPIHGTGYKPNAKDRGEGIADFVAEYLNNKESAARNYPEFTRYFEEKVKQNPDVQARLREAQDMLHVYNAQEGGKSVGAVMRDYGTDSDVSLKERVKDGAVSIKRRVEEELLDDKAPLKRVDKTIEEWTGEKTTADNSVYVEARLAEGRSDTHTEMLLKDKSPEKVATALNKIFGEGTIEKPEALGNILQDLKTAMKGKDTTFLKENGCKEWHEALDVYLLSKRILEIKDVGVKQITEAIAETKRNLREERAKLQDRRVEAEDDIMGANRSSDPELDTTGTGIGDYAEAYKNVEALENQIKQLEKSLNIANNYKMPFKEADARKVVADAPKELVDASEHIYQYNDNLMRIQVSAGLVSKEAYTAMKDMYKNYIPLAADLGTESSMGAFGKKGSNGIVNIGSVIEHINKTGDTHDIKKPLQTIAINTRRILNASNKNLAGRAFFDRVEQYDRLGAIAERVPVEEMRNGDNTVFIKRNGEEVAYETLPEIKRSLEGIDNAHESTLLFTALQLPAKILRAACVTTPAFLVKNLVRDMMGAPILGGGRVFKPGLDHARGLKERYTDSQTWYDYKASGATNANLLTVERGGVKSTIENLYGKTKGKWAEDVLGYASLYKPMRYLNEMAENATRVGKFVGDLKNGATSKEAAINARNVSLDFSRGGHLGREINRYIPFFNAALQEPVRIIEAVKDNPKQVAKRAMLATTTLSIATWMMNHDQQWYQDVPEKDKNTYWYINQNYRIPKPFGVGVLFGSSVERGLDVIYNDADGKKVLKSYAKSLFDASTPSGTPSFLTPWIEWTTNHSLFKDRPIVSSKYQRMPPEMQYDKNTSMLARKISEWTGASAMKVDNVLRGSGGSGISQWLDTADMMTGSRDMKLKDALKMDTAFTVSKKASQSMTDYYNAREEVTQKYNAVGGKDGMKKMDKTDRYNYMLLHAADEKIQALNKKAKAYEKSGNQAGLDEITQQKIKITRDAMRVFRK